MKRRILLWAGLAIATSPVFSAETDYRLRGGFAYSDNIQRAPSGSERDATSAVVGLEMRGSRPTGRLRYDVAADVNYNEYLNLDIDSEVLGRAELEGIYDFVPETFSWNANFGFDQIRGDISRPLAPGNAEDQITFSTGPTLRARFSSVVEAQLDGRYSRLSYTSQPFDNETLSARALVGRRANPKSLLALGASIDEVSYLSGPGASALDYQRREAFGRLELQGVRTSINLEAGYADISGDLVDDGGPMVRANLERRFTPAMTGFLNAVREYPTSDATPLSSDPTISGGGAFDSSLLTSGPRATTSLEGGVRLERPRTSSELAYTWRKEESAISVGERDHHEIRARLTRRFTQRVNGTVFGAVARDKLSTGSQSFKERIAGAEMEISFGRALGLDLRVEHRGWDGAVPAEDSSELSGGIFLRYSNRPQ